MNQVPVCETVILEAEDHVLTVTLNRPHVLNAFNQQMMDEFARIWDWVRDEDDVHCVVLRAAGERAFCTGVDVGEGLEWPDNPWSREDPGVMLSPKLRRVWKPVVCAVNGMAAGGAFYWINDSDIVICSNDATFFDPHVSYGLTAAAEPIGMTRRIPLGEVLRVALLGVDERLSASRALQIGLVSDVMPRHLLWDEAHRLATRIAAKPPAAIQGTVRAIWESLGEPRAQALGRGLTYTLIGNPLSEHTVDRASVPRNEWVLR